MYSNILIASDGTEASTSAALRAGELGFLSTGAVHLLAVFNLDSWSTIFSVGDEQKALIQENLKGQLDQLGEKLAAVGHSVSKQVVKEGGVLETVGEYCQTESIDLLVLGRHDYGMAKRLFGVGVSIDALQRLRRPLLIVPEQAKAVGELNTILVPLDFSESSLEALKTARKFAAAQGSELLLFHCVPFADYVPAGTLESTIVLSVPLGTAHKKVMADAKERLQKLVDEMTAAGEKARFVVGDQSTATGILEQAAESKASLIVLSSHGRSGFQKLFYGSVAESLIGRSEHPLLIVPAKAT
ncbi:MAG: universal stress protein [Planctomycetota bacterium]|nr:universal stress protein [Planctomycetota bacterium]